MVFLFPFISRLAAQILIFFLLKCLMPAHRNIKSTPNNVLLEQGDSQNMLTPISY